MPVLGLNGGSPDSFAIVVSAFRQGLKETGYIEGQNVTIEYRWQTEHTMIWPHWLANLGVSASTPANLVAKASATTIPIVPKRLDLAHELVPKATAFGLLINPKTIGRDRETRLTGGGAKTRATAQ